MDEWVKECRKALFWEVYWKTRASLIQNQRKESMRNNFLKGIKYSAA
jgi:hypothetical protein